MESFQQGESNDEGAFNASLSLLLTWDMKSEAHVTERVQRSSCSNESSSMMVNSLRFPGAITNQGVSSGFEDEFMNVLRVEGVVNPEERKSFYLDQGPDSYHVYRITPPPSFKVSPEDRFASFNHKMRTRWTGVTEHGPVDLNTDRLKAALERVREGVIKKHHRGGLLDRRGYVEVAFKSFVNDSGYECLEDGTKCQGDSRDTT